MPDDNIAARIAELEADNRRLRRLLDKRDAPGELRHRLRSTMAMLRAIIRASSGHRSKDAYIAHLEDRLSALMRALAIADEQGSINLFKLLVDELLHYRAQDGERVRLSGPDLLLLPRAGLVLALAIHELAVNAVEHGALGDGGRLAVAWHITESEPFPVLTLVWKEEQSEQVAEPSRTGFGTELLTRMINFELKAETELAYEPDGLRCTIHVPLSDRVALMQPS